MTVRCPKCEDDVSVNEDRCLVDHFKLAPRKSHGLDAKGLYINVEIFIVCRGSGARVEILRPYT